jgi:hypothetical protein
VIVAPLIVVFDGTVTVSLPVVTSVGCVPPETSVVSNRVVDLELPVAPTVVEPVEDIVVAKYQIR